MKVIATKPGYFGKLRAPGDEFDVPNDAKASWFEPVGGKPAKSGKAPEGSKAPAEGGDLV